MKSANLIAASVAVLACSGALAQQAASPTRQPMQSQNPPQVVAQAQTAPTAQQQGVVYPGRPIVGSPATAQAAPAPVSQPGQAGMTGQVIGQVPPNLPALPGATQMLSPARQYVEDNMPADLPQAIGEYKRRFDAAQRAAARSVADAPKPVTRTLTITQAPGESSPTARLNTGVPTNIVFTDSTGAPWPIEFATPGDATIVDVLVPVEGSSTLQIRPKTPYMGGPYGAVSVNLKGNPVPITMILAPAQKEVDTRVDLRVARRGPNATAPVIDRPGFTSVDDALMAVLDGVPPSESRLLKTTSADVQAWSYRNRLYVRTRLPLVSPAWSETASSVDGMRVYIAPTVPFVMVSNDGVLQSVRIGE